MLMDLESDNAPLMAERKRNEILAELIPEFNKLPESDQMASNLALKELLENPLEIEEPQPQTGYPAPAGPYNLPSLPPPALPPGTGHT